MKLVFIRKAFLLCFLFLCVGCMKQTATSIAAKTYTYQASIQEVKPSIILAIDDTFTFQISSNTNDIITGTYEEKEQVVSLNDSTSKATYAFKIEGERLLFIKQQSSSIPAGAQIPDGAAFE